MRPGCWSPERHQIELIFEGFRSLFGPFSSPLCLEPYRPRFPSSRPLPRASPLINCLVSAQPALFVCQPHTKNELVASHNAACCLISERAAP